MLEFKLVPFLVGTGLLVVLTVASGLAFTFLLRTSSRVRTVVAGTLFGLTVWAVLQHFLLPAVQPLVTKKGFTPQWYAASFGVYGAVLGGLLSLGGRRDTDGSKPAAAAPPSGRDRRRPPGSPRRSGWPSGGGPGRLEVESGRLGDHGRLPTSEPAGGCSTDRSGQAACRPASMRARRSRRSTPCSTSTSTASPSPSVSRARTM